ncbi:multidrug ABC transporter ATPase and permease [Streptococcus varani]|uniref:Multidrug ABC transporter ATPase and permease n=1 Tax=Streptococcus varani TaxID=1608583 RepID=A0A0E4H6Q1_9STRE|nr:ABC transporter ATP-binding protein [Streptococcus varani]CQR26061.1 multidrug ABC transporter ATPase and permease [Streptococcus varani]
MKSKEKRSGTFKKLFLLSIQQPWFITVFIIIIFLQVFLTVYLPILIGRAVDFGLEGGRTSNLLLILLQMAIIVFANTLLQWLSPILANRMVYKMVSELRQGIFEKIHHLPLGYLDRQSLGDLVARISSDSEQLINGLLMVFNQFFLGVLTIFFMMFTMANLDMIMMLLVVSLTPLSLFLARFIAKKSYHYYREQTQARGEQVSLLEESISQLGLVQAFNAQDQFANHFKTVNGDYARYSQAAIFASSTVNPTTRFINALIYALLAGLGALRIMQGTFTVGSLTTFLNYASQYSKPFNDISSVMSELQSAIACADRLFAISDQDSIYEESLEAFRAEEVLGKIDFKNVSFSYQADKPLIQDLNLSVPAGSKVAIVGPTGAGKSTLINLIMRFYPVNKGEILLDDQPITAYSRDSLRKLIGMVLQETWLKSATIHDNIAYGYPNATRELVIEAAKAANADFFIRQLPHGYDTYLADAGDSLSQGQRQLLAIARIFVKIPSILILDEATSSIDTRTELLIQEAFEKLMRGRTSFVIAHRLSTIQSADIILVMVDGKIVEQGNHAQLMQAKGFYYQMQQSQFAS